jgi:universal stress protein E
MKVKKILVVFDPTTDTQIALERAALIAKHEGSEIFLFSCIHSKIPKSEDKKAEIGSLMNAQNDILAVAIKPLVESGIKVTTEIKWKKDWYQAVVKASVRSDADAVIKASHSHSATQRLFKNTSDWTLIRQCDCPVLLVKHRPTGEGRRVVAAVNMRGEKDAYENINANILEFCKRYTEADTAEVHFLNAHVDLSSRPDRGSMIRACGVDGDNVHIRMGEPGKVIVECAEELDANLVVIGNSARSGLAAAVNSNTAERVVDDLKCDLLVIP